MMLNGNVDAAKASKGAEARSASDASSADEVFDQFLSLCDSAGPERCALAGGGQTAAERVEQLFAQGEARADPGAGGEPAAVVAPGAELRRSAAVAVRAAEGSRSVAGQRGGSRRRASGRRIGARERGERLPLARRLGRRDDLGGDLVRRRAGRPAELAGVAAGDRTTRADQPAPGPRAGLVAVGPVCLLAGRGEDNYRGPWSASTPNPILLINQRYDPNTGYANAVRAERTSATPSCSPTRATVTCSSRTRAPASTRRRSTTWPS